MKEHNIKHLFATLRILKDQNPKGFQCLDLMGLLGAVVSNVNEGDIFLVHDLFNQLVKGGYDGGR